MSEKSPLRPLEFGSTSAEGPKENLKVKPTELKVGDMLAEIPSRRITKITFNSPQEMTLVLEPADSEPEGDQASSTLRLNLNEPGNGEFSIFRARKS